LDLLNSQNTIALDEYEQAYRLLEQRGDRASIERVFAPPIPVLLPWYSANPLSSEQAGASGYVDVAFGVTKFGASRQVEILDSTTNATDADKAQLVRLIKNSRSGLARRRRLGPHVGARRALLRHRVTRFPREGRDVGIRRMGELLRDRRAAAGALIGLQFVVLTLIAERPHPRARRRAARFSRPRSSTSAPRCCCPGYCACRGTPLPRPRCSGVSRGLAGLIYTAVVLRRMWKQRAYKPDPDDWCSTSCCRRFRTRRWWCPPSRRATIRTKRCSASEPRRCAAVPRDPQRVGQRGVSRVS